MKSLSQCLQDLLEEKAIDLSALKALTLHDQLRAAAFGITPETVSEIVDLRVQLFKAIYPELSQLCREKLQIQVALHETLWSVWLPLAMQIAAWRQSQAKPLIQGFLGGQGTGKTTLTTVLALILSRLGFQTICFSLDDLYLTYDDRQRLQVQDPRLIYRGPPGTHDVELGLQVLTQLKQGNQSVQIPQFDKSLKQGAGDRIQPKTVSGAEIVLFEGWFVGVRPISAAMFDQAPAPIMTEADRRFARDTNTRLHSYLPLWKQLDRLIVLYVPDYRLTQQWRKEAEHKMIAQGKAGMSDSELGAFVQYFWRALHPELFIKSLVSNPEAVDLVIEVQSDHSPGAIYKTVRSV